MDTIRSTGSAVLQGYESVRTLSLAEWDAFPNELRYSSLRFTVTRLHDFFFRPVNGEHRTNKGFSKSSLNDYGCSAARKKAVWKPY